MKNFFLLLVWIVALILLSVETNAQWEQTGPDGGRVNDLAVCGSEIYAAAYGGVLVSNNGIDWMHSSFGLRDGFVNAVVATSSKVFAGSQDHGVYMKDLYGLIWTQTSLDDKRIYCLAAIGDYVFAGTSSTGVYLTTDNGTTWTQVNNGLTQFQVNCLVTVGNNIFAGAGNKVFLSTNNGANWTTVSTGLPDNTIISLGINGTDIYAGIWANGIWTSPNNGQGWTFFGEPVSYPHSFTFHGSDVYTSGGGGGIWRTTNGGTDWTKLNDGTNGMGSSAQIFDLSFIGENLVAAEWHVTENSSEGLYTSVNYGTNWTQINWGQPKYCANGIDVANGNLSIATCGGMYRSTDNGSNWLSRTIHTEYEWADFTAISFRSSVEGFAGDVNGYVYTTTNEGVDWWSPNPPNGDPVQIEEGAKITSLAFVSTSIFAATTPFMAGVAGGVYFSSDNGATWENRSNGLPTLADTNTVVSSLALIGNNLFAGTGHGVYMSADNGISWTQAGLMWRNVTSFAVEGTELFAGTYGQGVFRSNDNGTNWLNALPDKYVTALTAVDTNIFAGTQSQGVYWLLKCDSTWRYRGLPNVSVSSFVANNGYLFASTSHNTVWKAPLDILTPVDETKNNLPTDFILSQNFPNPFNPNTNIKYRIADLTAGRQGFGYVSLKVYDVLGREVATLVNEEKPVGEYKVEFDGTNLPSGVYLYQLKAGNFVSTKKMLLLK